MFLKVSGGGWMGEGVKLTFILPLKSKKIKSKILKEEETKIKWILQQDNNIINFKSSNHKN